MPIQPPDPEPSEKRDSNGRLPQNLAEQWLLDHIRRTDDGEIRVVVRGGRVARIALTVSELFAPQ